MFYKVIVFPAGNTIYATAFIMSHEQKMLELNMFVTELKPGMREIKMPKLVFTDFPYKKVFQVNVDFLENETGLNFKWAGVKRLTVPNNKNQLKKISKIKDADDAKKTSGRLTRAITTTLITTDEDVTEREIKNKNFRLNVIMP
jgi:hypothetical protein